MDALIAGAARALAAGDPLGALKRIALRDDAAALALRGIAMAQLGDFARASDLLRRAARAFGPKEAVAHARCVVAEADIALATRDLSWPANVLDDARATLEHHGDQANAAHARYLELRRQLLIGRVDEAEKMLASLDAPPPTAALRTVHELVVAGIAIRRLRTKPARAAIIRARRAAHDARNPALIAEVDNTARTLDAPAARLIANGAERLLVLEDVEALLKSKALIVDTCQSAVRDGARVISLARRPVLLMLARALGEAWPGEVPREVLIARAFRAKRPDASHRARLRVEIGRLRKELRPIATVHATKRGFALAPHRECKVVVLARPVDDEHADVLGLLADGEAWSSSALALALGVSQRTVQRALDALATSAKVRWFGYGRARRWMTPSVPAFTTVLLLPVPPTSL